MKIRLRLRQLRWHPASEKKTSRLMLLPIRDAVSETPEGLSLRVKTVLLSMDLIRFLALLLLFCGCGKLPPSSSKSPPDEQEPIHSASSEHHSHEEEHGILPHKPRTFTEAVDQIDKRGHALLSHHHDHHIAEWFDILGWLPEIAADTDLKEVDWDSVVIIGQDLEMWSAAWQANDMNQPDSAQLDALVVKLKAIVKKLPDRGSRE